MTQPAGSYFAAEHPMGAYFTPEQAPVPMGAYFMNQAPAPTPFGQLEEPDYTPIAATAGIIWLVARAGGGYVAGRAMAPRGAAGSWGVVGALVGLLAGPIGLGLMGVVALEGR